MNIQLTEKKEQIFIAALSMINNHGFHGSPMSKIAKEAQVSVGSIYHYFESKEELIIELYWYCKEILKIKALSATEANLPYEIRFRLVWKDLVLFYLDHMEIFGFLEQFYGSPYYDGIRTNLFKQKSERNILLHFMKEGVKANLLRDLNVRLLISTYLGVAISLIKRCVFEKSRPTEVEIETLVEIIWNGVKK
ncbi:MAG: TetR/AcrR family transcriptional regulator [Sphingobacterium sp.]